MLFSKTENKFATLQCAAQALFHFLFFISEQRNAPKLKDPFFFSFLEKAAGDRMEMASKHKNVVKSTLHSLVFLISFVHIPYGRNKVKITCLLNGGKHKKAQTR